MREGGAHVGQVASVGDVVHAEVEPQDPVYVSGIPAGQWTGSLTGPPGRESRHRRIGQSRSVGIRDHKRSKRRPIAFRHLSVASSAISAGEEDQVRFDSPAW